MTMARSEASEHVTRHLLRAEQLARSRDVSALDPARRLVRALLLQELTRYRRRGRFPRNPDFAAPTPYFVDAAGTRCAVGHLLDVSGERALVQRIASERNHARVCELADEPRLVAWLAAAGLTLEEAAAIQPTYRVERAACLCGGADFEITPFAPLPAQGVVIATVVEAGAGNTGSNELRVRVEGGEGDFSPYEIEQELTVFPMSPSALPPPGRTVVIPVHGDPDAGPSDLRAAIMSQDGTFQCSTGDLTLGPMTQQQLTSALLASDCKKKLGSFNARWDDTISQGGTCAAAPIGASAAEPSTLGVLLALTSVILARRRRSG